MSDEFEVKDSGKRVEYATGARRDTNDGKGRFDLLPTIALRRLAVHLQKGAAKYGDRNWERGIPVSRCYDSALRHLMQALEGKRDEDHLAAVLFNVAAIITYEERIAEGALSAEVDDRHDTPNAGDPPPQEKTVKEWPDWEAEKKKLAERALLDSRVRGCFCGPHILRVDTGIRRQVQDEHGGSWSMEEIVESLHRIGAEEVHNGLYRLLEKE